MHPPLKRIRTTVLFTSILQEGVALRIPNILVLRPEHTTSRSQTPLIHDIQFGIYVLLATKPFPVLQPGVNGC